MLIPCCSSSNERRALKAATQADIALVWRDHTSGNLSMHSGAVSVAVRKDKRHKNGLIL